MSSVISYKVPLNTYWQFQMSLIQNKTNSEIILKTKIISARNVDVMLLLCPHSSYQLMVICLDWVGGSNAVLLNVAMVCC